MRQTFLALLFAFSVSVNGFAGIVYSIVPVAGPGSNAFAINNNGDITGVYKTPGGADHAFFYSETLGFVDLGTLAGGNSIGRDLTNDQFVVGQSDGRAFKWSQSTGMVGLNAGSSDARSINNSSLQTLGTVYGGSGTSTIWNNTNSPSPYFITENTEGYGINDFGEFVGRVDGTTGYYATGTSNISYTDLGLFLPTAINNQGIVAGSENGIAGYYDSVSQTFVPIGTLDLGDTVSEVFNLNDLNIFAGMSGNGVDSKGFLWDQFNGFVDLTANLAPGFETWTVLSANDVNVDGVVTGLVRYQGNDYAAILNPTVSIPEVNFGGALVKLPYTIFCFVRDMVGLGSNEDEIAALEQSKKKFEEILERKDATKRAETMLREKIADLDARLRELKGE